MACRFRKSERIGRNRRVFFRIGETRKLDLNWQAGFAGEMIENNTILDIFIRGGAVAILLLCAALFLSRRGNRRKASSVAALCVGLSAYLLVSTPNLPFLNTGFGTILIMVASVVPVLVYWAAIELFLDDVTAHFWQFGVGLVIVLMAWFAPLIPFAVPLRGGLVILLLGHLIYVIFATAAGDLVESRRRFRRWFLVAVVVFSGVIAVVEIIGADRGMPPYLFPLHALVFLCFAGIFLIWATRIVPDIWVDLPTKSPARPRQSAAETALAVRIQEAMIKGLWKEEGLTISQLAFQLDSQEHRVRRAINQALGFRNFARFINGYRVQAAMELLADPHKADSSVLSIAYAVGFASLGPFNRAFRDITGLTPSQYRQAQIPSGGLGQGAV